MSLPEGSAALVLIFWMRWVMALAVQSVGLLGREVGWGVEWGGVGWSGVFGDGEEWVGV